MTTPVVAARLDRTFWRITGADAEAYLQGQLSQDVERVDRLGAPSFLLDPTGKVVALLRIRRDGDGFVLDTDTPAADATDARLRRFLLRSAVEIERLDGWEAGRVFDGPTLPQAGSPGAWPAHPYPQDVTGPGALAELDALGPTWLSPADADHRRIEAGVPVSGVDIGAETIPGEVGAWAIEQAVSFTKGCFTGQELVARIDSRGGNVPRPLRVLHAVGGDELTAPATVHAGGRDVGRATSATRDVALAAVARSVEPGDQVELLTSTGRVRAKVDAAA